MNKPILDACCGSRMFWFDKQNPNVLFADCRTLETTMKDRDTIRTLEITPDVIHDFTDMPYPDNHFVHIVFDPPHLIKGGDNSWLVKKYGRLDKDWQTQLKKGFDECMRVLAVGGTLNFKWNETQIPVRKIIETIDYLPLYGHKSGKAAKTHWLTFVKFPRSRSGLFWREIMEIQQITLSKEAERGIILSQLTEQSSMLISHNDIAFLTGLEYDKIQRTLSKKPDFPKPASEFSSKNKLYVSGDVIKWIKRYSPRFR